MIRTRIATALTALALALAGGVTSAAPGKKDPAPGKKDPAPAKKDPAPEPAPTPPVSRPASQPRDGRRIVGILDVKVDGVPPEVAAQFQKDLEAQVDTKHYWLAPRSRMHELMANSTKWTEGCVVGACLVEVKTQTGADLVLLAALTGSGTSFGYVVTLVRTDTGRVLAQESERCDVCTVNEALSAATLATVKILNGSPDALPPDHPEPVAVPVPRHDDDRLVAARHHDKVTGISLTLAGLATAAIGVTIYAVKNHANYGLATAAAGTGIALGGVVVLTF